MKTKHNNEISYLALAALALACVTLLPTVQAVTPAPDGGYANQNTAEGENALFRLAPNGVRNTAIGFNALFSNTGGGANTAVGASALANNTANDNTACGSYALANNRTGSSNVATGTDALMLNTTGSSNIANGVDALFDNTRGDGNTANGDRALFSNTIGNKNTAVGRQSLFNNTTGGSNAATGSAALFNNTTGSNNTATGQAALFHNTTGSSNIALGAGAGQFLTIGSDNIDIGNSGVAGEFNTIRIGSAQVRTFIKGISGAAVTGAAVVVNAAGELGVAASSARFKDEIKPMDRVSESVLALKPVTFRYKQEIDPARTAQFGLVAEEVEKVNPALVTRDAKGKPYTVRYDAVNAMLLNEFLKEHRRVEELEARLAQREKEFSARLEEQDAKIEKVNERVELNEPVLRTVNNSH